MILVKGDDQTFTHYGEFSQPEVREILLSLIHHPRLESIASSYNSLWMGIMSLSRDSSFLVTREIRCVYVGQKEYATVDPSLVDVVGTDGQGTCVGLVIRNPRNGMISVAHIDVRKVVEIGLTQMLSCLVDQDDENDDVLDVHIINGYNTARREDSDNKFSGLSFFICLKIIEVLCKSTRRFNIQTLHILNRNTIYDQDGNASAKFNGFLVETGTGSIFPTKFHETTKCPDAFIRNSVRLKVALNCPDWDGNRLLETYDTRSDKFCITPYAWDKSFVEYCEAYQKKSDREICNILYTVPVNENPSIAEFGRGKYAYFIKHPDWKEIFPGGQPRIFVRTVDGAWRRANKHSQMSKRTADDEVSMKSIMHKILSNM
ncbi:hypothetical protein DM860_002877 [Cuscuta australis]|uniref:Protein N-terminal asparagine amidohydrolase n=1 Tax=Cuscuta australis TaxID=267555 RepID=A0A328D1G2_9ASTE|nr:hypothetical protein DM860_002877 [Cuscuta australis]